MIAIISDIHGNFKALRHALEIIKERSVDDIYVCGDIVGYGHQPNECCELVQSLNCVVVAGNHDWAACGKISYEEFSPEATDGIEYTLRVLSKENANWLKTLPLTYTHNDFELVHATLNIPEYFYYPVMPSKYISFPMEDVRETFNKMNRPLCFVGHSHEPCAFLEKETDKIEYFSDEILDVNDIRSVIDVGSIGYPRQKSKKSCIVFYDKDNKQIQFYRYKGFPLRTRSIKPWSW
jgi:predicted phosphodiesterase